MGETKGSTSRKPTVPLLQFAFGTCQLQVLSCVFLLVICRAGNKLGDPLARPATPRDSSLESRFVWDPGQDQQKDCGWLAPSFTGWGADCFKKFQSHVPQGLFFQSPLSGVWQEEEGIWSCSERWQWQCAPQFLKHPGTSWDVAMLTKLQWFLQQSSYFHSDQPVPCSCRGERYWPSPHLDTCEEQKDEAGEFNRIYPKPCPERILHPSLFRGRFCVSLNQESYLLYSTVIYWYLLIIWESFPGQVAIWSTSKQTDWLL